MRKLQVSRVGRIVVSIAATLTLVATGAGIWASQASAQSQVAAQPVGALAYDTTVSNSFALAANSTNPEQLFCPSGDIATSGGYSGLQSGGVTVYESLGDGDRWWDIGFVNSNSGEVDVFAYTICLKAAA
jgi:hypothetical protein